MVIARGDRGIQSGSRARVLPQPRRRRTMTACVPHAATFAEVRVPDDAITREATEVVLDVAPPLLLHHSRRVFLWGSLQGEKLGLAHDPEL
jgi:hypothetical protein